jgi:hypothetical protein
MSERELNQRIDELEAQLAAERAEGVRLSYDEAWGLIRSLHKAGWESRWSGRAQAGMVKLEAYCEAEHIKRQTKGGEG